MIWTIYPELKAGWGGYCRNSFAPGCAEARFANTRPNQALQCFVFRLSAVVINMADVAEDIAEEARGVNQEIERDVNRVRTRCRSLVADDDPRPSPQLVRQMQSEVNKRVPVSSLYYPSDSDTSNRYLALGYGFETPGIRNDPLAAAVGQQNHQDE
jgi:hypothetical protein